MKAQGIIEKLLRGETLSETEIGLFLVDTSNSECIHEEVFKRRGAVEHVRTVKRVRGKLYLHIPETALRNSGQSILAIPDEQGERQQQCAESLSDLGHFDACIVCAESEDEAKHIHPDGRLKWNYVEPEPWRAWAESPEYVRCKLIGTAAEGIEKGVVMSCYVPLEPDD